MKPLKIPEVRKRKRKSCRKRTFFNRLHLSGFDEFAKSHTKTINLIWIVLLASFYTASIYCTLLQMQKFCSQKILVSPTEVYVSVIAFPQVTVCHTGNFNKTYLKENIRIEPSIVKRLNTTEDNLLAEFARYLNLFVPTNAVGQFSNSLWKALTEIFEDNFRDVQFSHFVVDAGHRGERVFKNCKYGGKRYPCTQIQIIMDTPSCYIIATNSTLQYFQSDLPVLQKGLKFDMRLNLKHIFNEWNDEANYNMDQFGVRLMLGSTPTPFASQTMFPGNSHAVISFQKTNTHLLSNCYNINDSKPTSQMFSNFYTEEICLMEGVENATMDMCNCHFVAGNYFPTNDLVCTPEIVRDCVRKKVVAADIEDKANLTVTEYWKKRCKPPCSNTVYDASAMFYALENDLQKDFVENKFTITYDMRRQIVWQEQRPVDIYTIFSYIGCIWSVYTGASVIAVVHTAILLGLEVFKFLHHQCIKRCLGNRLPLPLSTLHAKPRKYRLIPVKRYIRVAPL